MKSRKWLKFILLPIIFAIAPNQSVLNAKSPDKIYEKSDFVCQVLGRRVLIGKNTRGKTESLSIFFRASCFAAEFKDKTYILTNAHVVQIPPEEKILQEINSFLVKISTDSKIQWEKLKSVKQTLTVVFKNDPQGFQAAGAEFPDEEKDLAILKLKNAETQKKIGAGKLGDPKKIKTGDFLMIIGNPAGFQFFFSAGYISQIERVNNHLYIYSTAPVWGGNSGSPALNENGKIIGMAKGYFMDNSAVSIIIHLKEIIDYLEQIP